MKPGFFDYLLFIFLPLFIFLKLQGTIDWSWWWVLSPVWIWALLNFVFIYLLYRLYK